jgi:hypothetical protein
MVPSWYHVFMAMNLRLTDKQSAGLRKVAAQQGKSMQEAALEAIEAYISQRSQRIKDAIAKIATEDKDLLDRLSK